MKNPKWGKGVKCAYCGIEFRIRPARFNRTKGKVFYCTREHQRLANSVVRHQSVIEEDQKKEYEENNKIIDSAFKEAKKTKISDYYKMELD